MVAIALDWEEHLFATAMRHALDKLGLGSGVRVFALIKTSAIDERKIASVPGVELYLVKFFHIVIALQACGPSCSSLAKTMTKTRLRGLLLCWAQTMGDPALLTISAAASGRVKPGHDEGHPGRSFHDFV
jgi:hypothetical protein